MSPPSAFQASIADRLRRAESPRTRREAGDAAFHSEARGDPGAGGHRRGTLVAFLFVHALPGDPVLLMPGERGLPPDRYQEELHRFGFDLPIWQQYLAYLGRLLTGDFGTSFSTKKPVWSEFFTLFPATTELSFCAIVLAVGLGVPLGILAALNRGRTADHALMTGALVGYSMPIFWWAFLLIIVFSGWLGWTPVSSRIGLTFFIKPVTGFMLIDSLLSGKRGAFQSAVWHLILPSIPVRSGLPVHQSQPVRGGAMSAWPVSQSMRAGPSAHGFRSSPHSTNRPLTRPEISGVLNPASKVHWSRYARGGDRSFQSDVCWWRIAPQSHQRRPAR